MFLHWKTKNILCFVCAKTIARSKFDEQSVQLLFPASPPRLNTIEPSIDYKSCLLCIVYKHRS